MTKHEGWRRIRDEGTEWEARIISSPGQTEAVPHDDQEVLEFVCVDGSRKSRQVAIEPGVYGAMDEAALRKAFRRALPIGGDHYGRPGKHMNDVR